MVSGSLQIPVLDEDGCRWRLPFCTRFTASMLNCMACRTCVCLTFEPQRTKSFLCCACYHDSLSNMTLCPLYYSNVSFYSSNVLFKFSPRPSYKAAPGAANCTACMASATTAQPASTAARTPPCPCTATRAARSRIRAKTLE